MLQELFINPGQFFALLIALLIALSIHEASHAFVADYLGDETPRRFGRLTLNPLAHLDPFGTLFLFLAGFGWGKPVPINPANFANPKIDNVKVSLAGPLSNFAAAVLFVFLLRLPYFSESWSSLFLIIIQINLVLMVFNLFPIPPLDGSHLLGLILSPAKQMVINQLGMTFLFVLFFLSFLGLPILPSLVSTISGWLFHFLTGSAFNLF